MQLMPTSLERIRDKFYRRINIVDGAFDRHVVNPSLRYRIDRYALQEGLLSNLWQSWNLFCRDILIASAQGANTAAGVLTTSPYAGLTEPEIAFVFQKLSRNQNVGTIKPLSGRHFEPTWGDPVTINRISVGIGASNSSSLTSAFGGLILVSDLQKCRNACAHLNMESLVLVTNARVRYDDTSLRHPSEMMFWSDPSTKDFAWKSWIDEMMLTADFAVV